MVCSGMRNLSIKHSFVNTLCYSVIFFFCQSQSIGKDNSISGVQLGCGVCSQLFVGKRREARRRRNRPTVLPLETVPALCCRIAHPSDPCQVRMQTSPQPYDYSRANVFVAQDKARSTRFGPPEYTFLPLQPSGLRPSAL
jgi:hypothetical protein